jgi:hypothetical protein
MHVEVVPSFIIGLIATHHLPQEAALPCADLCGNEAMESPSATVEKKGPAQNLK